MGGFRIVGDEGGTKELQSNSKELQSNCRRRRRKTYHAEGIGVSFVEVIVFAKLFFETDGHVW